MPLLLIPLTLPYLGPSIYGAWMTMVSLTAMLVWADLGLGSGLLTRLSNQIALKDEANARRDIFAAYAIVASVGLVVATVGLLTPSLWSWSRVLGVDASLESVTGQIAVACILMFAGNMPLSLIQRIQYAAGQVSVSNIFTATGPLVSLLLTFLAVQTNMSALMTVLAATAGPIIGNATATLWFFSRHPTFIPTRFDRAGRNAVQLLSLGILFLLITTFSAVANNADNLIIAQVLDAEAVTQYAVPARLMAALGLLINLASLPLWPAYANAISSGDHSWVHSTTAKITWLSTLFVVAASLMLIAFGEELSALLSGGAISADVTLMMSLGVWWAVVAASSPVFMVQNAAGVLVPQLFGWGLFLLTSVPLKIWVATQFGLSAVPLAGAMCYVLTIFPSSYVGYRRALHRHLVP